MTERAGLEFELSVWRDVHALWPVDEDNQPVWAAYWACWARYMDCVDGLKG